jgi:hypothetical protein
MLESIQRQWSRYDYRNAVGTSIDRELGRRFALTEDEVEILVDRYVIPLADFPMLSEALALETASNDGFAAFGVGFSAHDTWARLRDQVHEPMRQRPDLHALIQVGLSPWDTRYASTGRVMDGGGLDSGVLDPVDADGLAGDEAGPLVSDSELAGNEEALANPDTDLLGPPPTRRGGAGRVGGYFDADPEIGELDTADSSEAAGASDEEMAGAGDPEIDEETDPPLLDDRGGIHRAVNPMLSLFEQLRQFEQGREQPFDSAPASEPDPEAPLSPTALE